MTEKPLVSVIINCYNSEKYLRETIDSLIAQTYDNWEAIFWDNCSTDKTAEIIASYNEPRFRYFLAERNTPLGEARNHAMEKVQGELLCFLDSDDVWLPEFLKVVVNVIVVKTDIVAVYTNYCQWKENKKKLYNRNRNSGIRTLKNIVKDYGIGMSACIIRFKIIHDNYITFDKSLHLVEDLDFFIRVSEHGFFYYVSDALCLYRVHNNSSSFLYHDLWRKEYHSLYLLVQKRYIDNIDYRLEERDLSRIRKCEMYWETQYCIKNKRRKDLALYLWENKDIGKYNIKGLFYVICGEDIYYFLSSIKTITNKLLE